jgi:hypothetical protein
VNRRCQEIDRLCESETLPATGGMRVLPGVGSNTPLQNKEPPRLSSRRLCMFFLKFVLAESERIERRLVDRGGCIKTIVCLVSSERFAGQRA